MELDKTKPVLGIGSCHLLGLILGTLYVLRKYGIHMGKGDLGESGDRAWLCSALTSGRRAGIT